MRRWRADVHNLSTAHNNIEVAPDRVWQDYATVSEDHHTVIRSEAEESRGASLKVASFCVESRKLPFPARARIIFLSMDYDVAIIGRGFSSRSRHARHASARGSGQGWL